MSWKGWFSKKATAALEADLDKNALDRVIIEKGVDHPEVSKVYQARWVWYHTILAVEIFFTNVLLAAILVVLIAILANM